MATSYEAWSDLGIRRAQLMALCAEAGGVDRRIMIREARAILGQATLRSSDAARRAREALVSAGWPDGPLRPRAS